MSDQILATACSPGGRRVHAATSGGTLHTLPAAAADTAAVR
ncbi:hypothetical protein ACFY20_23765 [Streptomyces sp. NPDC001312]